MASSWPCTDDSAVRSSPEDFGEAATSYDTVGSDLQDVSASWTTRSTSGWDDIDGKFLLGLQLLAEIIGERAMEMSGGAVDVKSAYTVCETELDALTATGDALLTESQELSYDRDKAALFYGIHDRSATTTRNERNEHLVGTTERQDLHADYVEKLRIRDGYGETRDTKAEELDTNQEEFDQLVDDEEAAHVLFSGTLDGVDVARSAVEVDVSGAEARSVELLITYLDARLLSLGGTGRGRNRRHLREAIQAAREAIAAMTDVDLDDHDRLVEIVEAKRELERLGPDAVADRIHELLNIEDPSAADLAELQRLRDLIADGTAGMSPEDRDDFIDELIEEIALWPGYGLYYVFSVFAVTDGDIPPWLIEQLIEQEALFAFNFADPEVMALLAFYFDLDGSDASAVFDEVLQKLFRQVLATEGGFEALVENGTIGPVALGLAYQHLLNNPSLLDGALNGRSSELQVILDLFAGSGATDAQMDDLLDLTIGRLIEIGDFTVDTSVDPPEVGGDMAALGDQVGKLLYQFGRAGEGSTYDPSGIIELIARKGIRVAPFGSVTLEVIDTLDVLFGGYQQSTLYTDLEVDDRRATDETVVAISTIIAAGGPVAETLSIRLQEAGGAAELATTLLFEDRFSDDARYVNEFKQEITGLGGISEAGRDD